MNMIERLGITPGPWHADLDHIFQDAFPTFRIGMCDSNIANHKEELNNARLIAAAPEMLEDEIENSEDAATIIKCLDKGDIESIRYFALNILGRSRIGQQKATGKTWTEIKELS